MKKKWKVITGILTVLFCMLIGCKKKTAGESTLLVTVNNGQEVLTEETDDLQEENAMSETEEQEPSEDGGSFSEEEVLVIHICGAVKEPGIYLLETGSRLYQAVDAAGGFADNAGEEYLNLAETLQDGKKIYIPTIQEAEEEKRSKDSEISVLTGEVSDAKVNINTASAELLCTLPGIGSSKAESIITYREVYGEFKTTEDIMNVEGIKDGLFRKIKDKITV